ncbi:MAG: hypothetical protein SGBAC_010424 [Bacillariaceae sp.]
MHSHTSTNACQQPHRHTQLKQRSRDQLWSERSEHSENDPATALNSMGRRNFFNSAIAASTVALFASPAYAEGAPAPAPAPAAPKPPVSAPAPAAPKPPTPAPAPAAAAAAPKAPAPPPPPPASPAAPKPPAPAPKPPAPPAPKPAPPKTAFSGSYTDPNHPGGKVTIKPTGQFVGDYQLAEVVGGGGKNEPASYTLPAVIMGERTIFIDFSGKGGPKNFVGFLNMDGDVDFLKDGNRWSKAK